MREARIAGYALPLCLVLLSCHAGTPHEEGVLALGYRMADGSYETAVMTVGSSSVQVAGSLADIIVRRSTGFWRIGVTPTCDADGRRELVRESPFDRPLPTNPAPCPIDGDELPDHTGGERGNAPVGEGDARACADHSAAIEFVSAEWIATRYTFAQTEACEPRGGRWRDSLAVRPLGVQGRYDLSAVFGDSADLAWDTAVRAAFVLMERDGWNCPPPDPGLSDLASWVIERRDGAWRAVAGAHTDLGECGLLHEIDLTLPDSITGEADPSVAFSAVQRMLPAATDYVLSPDRRFMVIITLTPARTLTFDVHAVEGMHPGRKLLGDFLRPDIADLVMVQWSAGPTSREWLRLLE